MLIKPHLNRFSKLEKGNVVSSSSLGTIMYYNENELVLGLWDLASICVQICVYSNPMC